MRETAAAATVKEALERWWEAQRVRHQWVAHATLSVLAVMLAFTPLFNLLGFEFSMAMAVAASVVIGPVTFGSLELSSPSSGGGGEAASSSSPGPAQSFVWLAGHNMSLLLGPLLLITLNGLRVRVCDYPGGLTLYVIVPGVTVLYATLAAMASWGLLGHRRLLRHALYYGLVLCSVAGGAAYLALEPPIVAVNPYVGYFAGSIYDEALAVPLPLLLYRALLVVMVVGLVAGLEAAHRRRAGRAVGRGLWGLMAACLLIVGVGHGNHSALGYSQTREDIQEALGGRYETEHFIIYFPASGDWGERIEQIAEDHEFRYAQLERFFGSAPEGKLVSYIYPSSEEKGRLMGARRTLVAKLWLGETHILYPSYGYSVLKHELAHLFTAPFGSGPLDLSTRAWVFPNMGLVEGIATAAQWEGKTFTPHGWSAALRRLKKAPDMTRILGARFWTQHSRTVYTLMGSFSRWLIDTRGIEAFKVAYAHGDFEAAYGAPLSELVEGWHAFLDEIPLSEADLEMARFRFDRPSIFGKVCARALAERRRRVALLAAAGRHGAAAEAQAELCELDPNNLGDQHARMQHLVRARELDKAHAVASALLAREGIGESMRARIRADLGDLLWRRGERDRARAAFEAVATTPGLEPEPRRAAQVRLVALDDPRVSETVRAYFLEEGVSQGAQIARLYRARRAHPEVSLLAYLLGLQLVGAKAHEEAAAQLKEALALGLGEAEIIQKARFELAKSLYFAGDWEEAGALFEALSREGLREGDRARAADWTERTLWRQSWDGP